MKKLVKDCSWGKPLEPRTPSRSRPTVPRALLGPGNTKNTPWLEPSLASRIALVLMMLGLLPLAFGFSLQPVPVSLPPLRRDNGPQHGLRMVDTPQPQPETVDRFLAKYAWNPLRRNVYALLKPVCTRRRSRAAPRLLSHVSFFDHGQVDKGEFRWEFLVPWVNRSLTTIDKVVVCSAFVVASFTLQKLFDPGASVGP